MTEADGSDSLVAPACYSGLTLKLVRGDGLENACPEGCGSLTLTFSKYFNRKPSTGFFLSNLFSTFVMY